ncbi:MAG TPA: nucleotide exchange factor GrpE [Thermoplasmata archaeon]|nr:nucleotide exchange factor GrpE [Thermoplasmata archaeon]
MPKRRRGSYDLPVMAEEETPHDPEPTVNEPESAPNGPLPPPTPVPPFPEEPDEPEEDWSTRYKYLLAEFDNFRKRTEREREVSRKEVRAMVLRQLLPIHEAFTHAEEAALKLPAGDPLRRGMELLVQEWKRFLTAEQFRPVARVGDRFHPDDEEAIAEIAADAEHEPGTVAEVVQQGYRSPGGLLRPAKVVVVRSKDTGPPGPAAEPVAESPAPGTD